MIVLASLSLLKLPILGKLTIILIVSAFMPLTAITFFRYMIPKRQKEYSKSISEMGINTSRKLSDVHNTSRYFLPVSFVTVICLLASASFTFADTFINGLTESLFLTGAYFGDSDTGLIKQSLAVLSFAFLGSFIWSAQNIIRRLIANDLAPNVYYSAGIRIIMASVIALILSFSLGAESDNGVLQLKNTLIVLAFLTGMFPERVLGYLIDLYKKYVNPDDLNEKQLSLYRIEGISMTHKERLNEIGIDNAQNLATASLTELCIQTPFPARQLLDWIGQAKLICYVKEEITKFRSIGIRSVFDLYQSNKTAAQFVSLAEGAGINAALVEVVMDQVRSDVGIRALYNFMNGVNTPSESSAPDKETSKEEALAIDIADKQ